MAHCAALLALASGERAAAGALAEDCTREVVGTAPGTELAIWLEREKRCAADAAYLYRLGRMLNAAGRYPEALERLEGALLRSPDDWRIQLEYVFALAGSGDEVAALDLLRQLRERREVDPVARREIDALLDRRWLLTLLPRGTVGLAFGYDDNLLGNAHQGPFDLTLPYGKVTVEPGENQRALAGSFIRADARLEGGIRYSDGEHLLQYGFYGSWRWTPGQPAERSQWGVVLEKNNVQFSGAYLQASYQQLALEAKNIYTQVQLGTGFAFGVSCSQRAGIELQSRRYPQIPVLDGAYFGLQWQGFCVESGHYAQFRAGRDAPQAAERPGGRQDQASIRLGGQRQALGGRLQANFEYSWLRDAEGYSPLLENNRRRRIGRAILRFEYLWPMPGWQPFISLERLDQRANLPLFSVRNTILSVGANLVW